MATVNEKIAKEIIANNGYYLDDPRVTKVVSYENVFTGNRSWAILYEHEHPDRYLASEFVISPKVEWEADKSA